MDPDQSPIVIGGLGGSGTRVFAEALLDAGVDLGRLFNGAYDNLVFTALFKRPRWYAHADDATIGRHLDTFARYSRDRAFGPGDWVRLARCVTDHDPTVGPRESAGRVRRALHRRPLAERRTAPAWGWKEPNSHLYLPQLGDHFSALRFVYVARHGLDMAYNENKTQLRLFGAHFGIPFPVGGGPDAEAVAQLDYWIAMTRRAVDVGTTSLGERFRLVRYDDLCRDPHGELGHLLDFAGVPPGADFERLAARVQTPSTSGRWRLDGTRPFTDEQVAAVGSFGFDL